MVAVPLDQRLAMKSRRFPSLDVLRKELGQEERLLGQPLGVLVMGNRLGSSSRNTARQLGSMPITGAPARMAGRNVSRIRRRSRSAVWSIP